MRRSVQIPMIVASLVAFLLFNPSPTPNDKTRNELLEIEKHIGRANLSCDYAYFRRVEAEEFFFSDPSGHVTTRAQDLAGEKDCKKHEGTFSLSDERVLRYGNVAVVSAIGTYTTTKADGTVVTKRNRFTDIFARRKGNWVAVAGHSSNLKEP